MLLRKINAGISMMITLLLLEHAVSMGAWMLSRGEIAPFASKLPRLLFAFMMVHAIISIVLAVLGHKGAEKRKCNNYSKMNVPTYIQRASGMLMIVFSVLHVLGATGVMQPPLVVHAIVPPLFFALSLTHAMISASKALITLGIGNARIMKVTDIAMRLICGAILIADVIGFYLYRL